LSEKIYADDSGDLVSSSFGKKNATKKSAMVKAIVKTKLAATNCRNFMLPPRQNISMY